MEGAAETYDSGLRTSAWSAPGQCIGCFRTPKDLLPEDTGCRKCVKALNRVGQYSIYTGYKYGGFALSYAIHMGNLYGFGQP